MKYIFGPVPSRRLGQSLGIDPIPLKTCNWNCVYCQLGRSVPLTNERQEYFTREEILAEVEQALKSHTPGEIDWVTFVGSGETTLHAGIGWLVQQVTARTEIPVAVITNGSLLYLPEVRQALYLADAVLPTLDAGSPGLYRTINRPHPDITFERLVEGLLAFRKEYSGKLWVEVMLIKGLNDNEPALKEIATVLDDIHPDEVHIILPERPPAEIWVQPADENGLSRACTILGISTRVIRPASGVFDLSGAESLVEAVIGIITRHPMRESELVETLKHYSPAEVLATLAALDKSGKAQQIERLGTCYWSASPAFYPSGNHNEGD